MKLSKLSLALVVLFVVMQMGCLSRSAAPSPSLSNSNSNSNPSQIEPYKSSQSNRHLGPINTNKPAGPRNKPEASPTPP